MTLSQQNREVLVRAAKTFIQAFLASWAISNYDLQKGAITGAAAAGISALMNIFFPPAPTV